MSRVWFGGEGGAPGRDLERGDVNSPVSAAVRKGGLGSRSWASSRNGTNTVTMAAASYTGWGMGTNYCLFMSFISLSFPLFLSFFLNKSFFLNLHRSSLVIFLCLPSHCLAIFSRFSSLCIPIISSILSLSLFISDAFCLSPSSSSQNPRHFPLSHISI